MPLLLPYLKQRGHLDTINMTIASIGSRKISEQDDFGTQGWQIFAPNLTIYGFDADVDACNDANKLLAEQNIIWNERHIPQALANKNSIRDLYVTKNPMCSSLFPPNEPLIKRYLGLADVAELDFTVEIETATLDTFCKEEKIDYLDFLQIDVQGAEILVLEGSKDNLSHSILAIQSEVSFSEIYKGQPLFTDIDQYLRTRHFTLFDYDIGTSRRVRSLSPISSYRKGQLLWGEAYYFRDLLNETVPTHFKTPQNFLKLACIADILEFPDYTLELFEYLTIHYSHESFLNYADVIVECLANIPQVMQKGLHSLPIIQNILDYVTPKCKQQYKL